MSSSTLSQAALKIADWSFDTTGDIFVKVPALAQLRGLAIPAFSGLPTRHNEEYKYTSLREISETAYVLEPECAPVPESTVEAMRVANLAQGCIVFINGHYCEDLTTPLSVIEGLTVRTFQCAADKDPEFLARFVGKQVNLDEFPLAALNTATFRDGVMIHVAKNCKIDRPIQILNITVPTADGAVYTAPRHVIHVEEGAEATLIETFASYGEAHSFSNSVTEIVVDQNASLQHVKRQNESAQASHIATVAVRQGRDSAYNSFSVTFGGGLTRNDWNVYLDGENIHTRIDGVVVASGKQHVDNHTRLDHAMPNCQSYEVYKHILRDESTAVFNGKIFVHQDAQKTDAKQTNNALLMSPEATMYSKPQLEIFADDVKCTHGATIGQIDEEPLFYMRARGIAEKQAQALLVYAFAAEVLERITVPELREVLESELFSKMGLD